MRVLVGIDLRTSGHRQLVRRAGEWAQRLGGQLHLAYVEPRIGAAAEHTQRLVALLSELPEELQGGTEVRVGEPAAKLIEMSADADVLVVGSREPPVLERWLKGPMAARVLREARSPVLVPRAAHDLPQTVRLLVGVDIGGTAGRSVLALAAGAASAVGGRIDAVYAEPSRLPHIADRGIRERVERDWEARSEPARQELEALMAAALPDNLRGAALVRRGEPEDVLVTLSADYDLVLVGNRDRTGLAQLLLGTVAQQVVRRAQCDVMSLPTATVLS